ncbi:MAG: CDP-alcohol phosphatidyltransferase family protein [Hyphomicrobiaceae bacterium]
MMKMTKKKSSQDKPLALPVLALVHVFTGLGAVCAFFAVLGIYERNWELVFFWLGLALLVDALDGPIARALAVQERLKRFSGERLDLVVDFLNYVFVPVVALRLAGFLPGVFGLMLCGAILLSSLFHFADLDSKTDTNHFVGFPAIWNVVAFYMFALAPSPSWVGLVVIGLIILTFVPVSVVHPVRVKQWRALTLTLTSIGGLTAIGVLWNGLPAPLWAKAVLSGIVAYYIALSLRQALKSTKNTV